MAALLTVTTTLVIAANCGMTPTSYYPSPMGSCPNCVTDLSGTGANIMCRRCESSGCNCVNSTTCGVYSINIIQFSCVNGVCSGPIITTRLVNLWRCVKQDDDACDDA